MTQHNKPNFIGIGATKSASTWLWLNLKQHPGIDLPPLKELHYFNRLKKCPASKIHKRIAWLTSRDNANRPWFLKILKDAFKFQTLPEIPWYLHYLLGTFDDEWYFSLFDKLKPGSVTGEITPCYSALEIADIQAVYRILPDAKIVFLMRNPVDRAWSHLKHYLSRIEKRSVKVLAEQTMLEYLNNALFFSRGNYPRILDNWQAVFPEHQIFLGFFDEVLLDPEGLMKRLFRFLGLDPAIHPGLIRTKISSSESVAIPQKIKDVLIEQYTPILKDMSARYGSFPAAWLTQLNEDRNI